MSPLRIVFAGTPEFGLPCLQAIAASSHQLLAVYTQPDRPVGRGQMTQFSPIKHWALAHQLPVHQPFNFKDPATVTALAALKPDVIVVIAYGLLLPESVLNIARYGCINVHASLLPRWRGASPIQQVILHGDTETGVTLMRMDRGLDTGPMYTQARIPVARDETTGSLHDKLMQLAIEPLLVILDGLGNSTTDLHPQEEKYVTHAPKITKEEAHINWSNPASMIERQIRAYRPWPTARTYGAGTLMRVHQAECVPGSSVAPPGAVLCIDKHGLLVATGQDQLCIKQVQFAGGKVMSVADWLNGGRALSFMHLVLE